MKQLSPLIIAAITICFSSCQNKTSNAGSVLEGYENTNALTTKSNSDNQLSYPAITAGMPQLYSPQTGEVKRNPPHGQPGHRHDLPDGAVLPGTGETIATPPPEPTTTTSAATTPGTNPPHGQPGHRHDLPDGAPLNSTAKPAAATTTASGMNPAHGQPGHRCNIAVGAPLNSAPAKSTPAKPLATTTAAKPADGKNPAHGQPGHRCDIAVGAPLDTPPAKKTTSATPATSTGPAPAGTTVSPTVVSPAAVFPSATPQLSDALSGKQTTTNTPKLNPKHGEPGHRCDIAVGKPLN